MTDTAQLTEEIPASVDLKTLKHSEPVAEREAIAARGRELFPLLTSWVRKAAPLIDWPELVGFDEGDDEALFAIHAKLGLVELEEMRDLLWGLGQVFVPPASQADELVGALEAAYPALTKPPAGQGTTS